MATTVAGSPLLLACPKLNRFEDGRRGQINALVTVAEITTDLHDLAPIEEHILLSNEVARR